MSPSLVATKSRIMIEVTRALDSPDDDDATSFDATILKNVNEIGNG